MAPPGLNERLVMEETMYEEIDRRISELQRDGWEWVKQGPDSARTMCAIVDCKPVYHYDMIDRVEYEDAQEDTRLSGETITRLNQWLRRLTDSEWCEITTWNDAEVEDGGASSVEEVIELLEKFRAEL